MLGRVIRNLMTTRWHLRRVFTAATLARIEDAIRASEKTHAGELRVALEAGLDWDDCAAGLSARDRAIEVFSDLKIWDTAQNNGVLIYVLLAEQAIEIVVDRGYRLAVPDAAWAELCRLTSAHFAASRYEQGILELIAGCSEVIARHFPYQERDTNELSDTALVL